VLANGYYVGFGEQGSRIRPIANDDFGELRNREIVSQFNKIREIDNWTN